MTRFRLSSLVAALIIVLAGCGGGGAGEDKVIPPNGTDPFPLAVGNRWAMQYHDSRFPPADSSYAVAGTADVDGEKGYVLRRSYGTATTDGTYRHSDSGVWLQRGDGTSIQTLRLPLTVGDQWTQLDQVVDTGYDVDGNGHNEVETALEQVTVDRVETVTTPAGTFAGAIVVSKTGDWEFKDPASGDVYDFSTLLTREWFVPGVGVVRREVSGIPWGGIRDYGWTEVLVSYSVAPPAH